MARIRLADVMNKPRGLARYQANDSLENFVSGMGTPKDKEYWTRWISFNLGREQVTSAYRGDWIARKVVDIPANDATREWRNWQADPNDITLIEDLEGRMRLQEKVKWADRKGRLFGGGALVMGVNQGKPEDPLIIENIKKDDLKFIHVVSRYDVNVEELDTDVMSPFYGQPKWYMVNSQGQGHIRIHPSRVVRFVGMEHPDPILDGTGWGDPVLQVVADAVRACSSVASNVASLLHELQVDIVKIPEMMNQMGTADYEDRLKNRFGLAATTKSLHKILLLDKEEEWQRVAANLAGMPDIVKVYLMIASGAADIPATRLIGQSPQGMNATGDSDIRNYYDMIKVKQTTEYDTAMEILNEVIIRSALGARPEEIFHVWNPLWQLDEVQEADLAAKKAATFKVDVDAGVIEAPILREARINQLIEDNTYPGLEQIIEEMELSGELDEFHEEEDDKARAALAGALAAQNQEGEEEEKLTKDGRPRRRRIRLSDLYRPREFRGLKRAGKFAPIKQRRTPAEIEAILTGQDRIAVSDATRERPMYVRRDVLNGKEILAFFKKQKAFSKMVQAKDLHVTLAYSIKPVDWSKAGEAWSQDEKGHMTLRPGGPRIIERFQDAVVLVFTASELQYRHQDIHQRTGAEWSWPDYTPHITITYNGADVNIDEVKPWTGPIVLGPEIFEEATEGWSDTIIEDAKAKWIARKGE